MWLNGCITKETGRTVYTLEGANMWDIRDGIELTAQDAADLEAAEQFEAEVN